MGRAVKKVHRPLQRDVQLYSKTLLQPKHRSLPAVRLDVHAGMFVHAITAPAMGVQVLSLSRFTITPTLNFCCCFLIEYFSLYMWLYSTSVPHRGTTPTAHHKLAYQHIYEAVCRPALVGAVLSALCDLSANTTSELKIKYIYIL